MAETMKKEDRRVRRTRKILTQALTELLQQKQVNEITVKELTDLADMNRGTFYLYYRDIFQMLESIEDELLEALNQILGEKLGETPLNEQMLTEMFEFIRENREIMGVLMSFRGDICFLYRLNRLIREKCMTIWDITTERESEFNYDYNFVAFGCAGLVMAWIDRGCPETSEKLARRVNDILQGQRIGVKAYSRSEKAGII